MVKSPGKKQYVCSESHTYDDERRRRLSVRSDPRAAALSVIVWISANILFTCSWVAGSPFSSFSTSFMKTLLICRCVADQSETRSEPERRIFYSTIHAYPCLLACVRCDACSSYYSYLGWCCIGRSAEEREGKCQNLAWRHGQ